MAMNHLRPLCEVKLTVEQSPQRAYENLHRTTASELWSIVLSGGEGSRTRPYVQERFGRSLPKQYCAFTGTRSLLQHTLDRTRHLASDDHTMVIIDQSHKSLAQEQLSDRPSLRIIHQPCNRDTAPGVFFPLTYVRQMDPKATVIIHPADHFVFPEERYITALHGIAREISSVGRLILLGVVPDRLELEYGWIIPGSIIAGSWPGLCSVRSFVEKPSLAEAETAMNSGGLWNTLVLIGRVEQLWAVGWKYLPELMPGFERLGEAIGSNHEDEVIRSIYSNMPMKNFSSDLLQPGVEHLAVVKLQDVDWSDWGNRERILASLQDIKRDRISCA